MADASELIALAAQQRRGNQLSGAERNLVEAVDIYRATGTPEELARALTSLGQIERDLRRLDAALAHYQESADLYRSVVNAPKLAHTIRHVADIYRNQHRPDLAEPRYHEALAIYRADQNTSPLELANAIRGLAILKSDCGDKREARLLWEEAKSLYEAAGVEAGVAESEQRIAALSPS